MTATHSDPVPLPAGHWDELAFGPVRDVNEEVVEVLCAAAQSAAAAPLAALARTEFLPATAAACRRLAECPYLLLDAGFAEPARWRLCSGVREAPAAAQDGAPAIDCGVGLARRALVLGWHLARANRLAARVALGMTAECAELIGALRLAHLDAIAEDERRWVRLRWEGRVELWRPLLAADAGLPEA
jgi:hypothetical protein